MSRPLHVGLTGGIGSGKTTVTDIFSELGVPIIDADVVARRIVEAGEPAFEEIVTAFGTEIVAENGQLDRSALRKLVFADPAARKQLESITHPRIKLEMSKLCEQVDFPYCIISSPLLLESRTSYSVDRILVIDLPEAEQVQRASARDQSEPEQIKKIIESQMPRQQRLEVADDIIVNDRDLHYLREQVLILHENYMSLADSGISTQTDENQTEQGI